MTRSSVRVAELAQRADMDVEEVIVALWDAGFDEVMGPDDRIPKNRAGKAASALGIASHKDELRIEYWLQQSGLDRREFATRVAELGVVIAPDSRRLPKGSLRRVRAAFQSLTPAPPVSISPLAIDHQRSGTSREQNFWEVIGKVRPVETLGEGEVLLIHERLADDFAESEDPIYPVGVRDGILLSSAVSRPLTGLGEERKYPSVEMASAALFHSLIHNHPFHNGNKRTALVALLAMLDRNGMVLCYDEQAIFKFTLRTAQHGIVDLAAGALPDREVITIATWLKQELRPKARGERPLKWIRLRQILVGLGCTCLPVTGSGNRLVITRPVRRRRRILGERIAVLNTHVAWAGDGTEASRSTIHKIRQDLELDEEHGVDSNSFYSGAAVIDSFIAEYSGILRRLARL